MHAAGEANDQASGIALRTRRGAKLAKMASTTPASTSPSGAARKPKYPIQKPFSPMSTAACRDSSAK